MRCLTLVATLLLQAAADEHCADDSAAAAGASDVVAGATRSLSLAPQLCVCVLSMRRLDLLRVTLRAITEHLEHVETGVSYEIVWVDNGSDADDRAALHKEFRIEKALLLGTNYGMAFGFNSLFFRLCSAPYFLSLEEDWEWIGASGVGRSAIADSMAVLRQAGVKALWRFAYDRLAPGEQECS